ncbi:MAG: glycosyl transferase [Oceanospirillaceae bacterium]|nr:glycosyl transferase [Oceanospirillaceae bacterium]|tara:strand:+ start:169 stop:1260 length:1092 start_codon:yes stop_codon:yes gene_type:complete
MKVAIVHYWLNGMRGGEKVLESLCRLYPQADIYTHVYEPEKVSDLINSHTVHTSFISKLPFGKKKYQSYLPFMPIALEQLDLTGYDLVISSESGPAKGVITNPEAVHVCYCHSPMRYVWDMYYEYFKGAGKLKRLIAAPLIHYLKMWDYSTGARVDHFIANSSYIAKRIEKIYRRDAEVINPPVEFDAFSISEDVDDYYLVLGQMVQYKRVDLAVEAFIANGKKLVIVGDGEKADELREMAKGHSNIDIRGRQPFSEIVRLYSGCQALIFPGVEDFGIVPLEAMASGRPVIAYGRGGVLDSVVDGKTGIYFNEQTAESLNQAVAAYEAGQYDFKPEALRAHAMSFATSEFEKKLKAYIDSVMP